jgi:molecular chaperone HtpG
MASCNLNEIKEFYMSRENIEFKAEVNELLNLVIHSLYTNKEIFLRELISNASDAIDKLRYEALTDKSLAEGADGFKIKLVVDEAAGTLTISDNGIGLSREDAIRELGTIAHSGTREYLEAISKGDSKDNPDLIGQFGVGFYSAFMVADDVTVISKKAGSDETAIRWESTAHGSFTIEDDERSSSGTDVIVKLKDEDKEYLSQWRLREIVTKYSDFIEHPIVMDVEEEEADKDDPEKKVKVIKETTLNSLKAIWLKKPAEITDEEYKKFYSHVSHDFFPPAETIHFKAEGTSEFTALVFIPSQAPMDILYKDFKPGPMLYVRRVQIMQNCEELIPPYLRFIKGVVDSSDLPLNVSREMLQKNPSVEVIKKSLTKKVLDALKSMKDNRASDYEKFYEQLGRVLKEGIHYDFSKKEEIAALTLLETTTTEPGALTDLDSYVERMKPDQEEIYYITAPTRADANASPYLERFKDKGIEVLIMLDEVDDIIMSSLGEYKGKKIRSVTKGDITLKGDDEPSENKELDDLIGFIAKELEGKVKNVRLSGRLTDSPCCIVTDEGGMDHNMEAMMKAMGQEVPKSERTLELNPKHPLVIAMDSKHKKGGSEAELKEYVALLYGQARLLMGDRPEDPAEFAGLMNKLMVRDAKENKEKE